MTYAENVVACYARATDAEIADGMTWYNRAHDFAASLDPSNVWRAAGVISALSPRKEWGLNMRLAIRAFDTGVVTGNTGAQNDKAQRILDGNHSPSDILAILSGDKTRQFASAIALNGVSDIAVIDRHAFDVATATVHTDKTRPTIGKRVYRTMSAHYREAAFEVGISVAQIQAVTWVTWKREKGSR
jgi:hypothetical protein